METIIFKTLLHSLWQGLILAVITALILMLSSKSTAKLRYNLLISGLILFTISIGSTFIYEWQQAADHSITRIATVISAGQSASGTAIAAPGTGAERPFDWINSSLYFFSKYANVIVLVWFLVICMRSVQLFAGLYSIKRIRRTQVTEVGMYWENRVKQLAAQFGISQAVGILQSGIAKVPMVVGHFKPLILIPVGLINGLSEAEVESILCHELAHIKRRDYLVNILQSFMEIVFFFNPAVLWISKLIREERESCCDDMTVSSISNKAVYISALINCQEFQMNTPEYAMAVSGHKDQLVSRVKRMVSSDRPSLSKIEKGILAIGLVSALTLTAAFSGSKEQQADLKSMTVLQDSIKTKKKKIKTVSTAVSYKSIVLWKDEKTVPLTSEESKANDDAKEFDRQMVIEDAITAAEDSKAAAEDAKAKAEDAKVRAEDEKIANEDKRYVVIDRKEAFRAARAAAKDRKEVYKAAKEAAKDRKEAAKDAGKTQDNERSVAVSNKINIAVNANVNVQNNSDVPVTISKTVRTTTKTGIQADYLNKDELNDKIITDIIEDLVKDRFIVKGEKLSYKINKSEFMVNRVNLSADVHKRYAQKYLKRPDWGLYYNYSVSSTGDERTTVIKKTN